MVGFEVELKCRVRVSTEDVLWAWWEVQLQREPWMWRNEEDPWEGCFDRKILRKPSGVC